MTSFSQTLENTKIQDRLTKIENENIALKAKIEAYNDNNSSILSTVSVTLAVLLGIFGLVNISQLIQNYRMNNKKLSEIENRIAEKNEKQIDIKVNSTVLSKLSELKELKNKLLEIEISTLQNKCPSVNPQNINIEILNLVELLKLSYRHYKETRLDYHTNKALEGFITHLEKHSIAEYEKEEIVKCLKEIDSNFDFKKEKIHILIKEQN